MDFSLDKLRVVNISSSRTRGDWENPLKKADNWFLVWVYKGKIKIEIKNKTVVIPENGLFILRKNRLFKLLSADSGTAEYIILRFEYGGKLPVLSTGLYLLADIPHFGLRIHQMLIEHRFKDTFYEQKQKLALADLLIGLYRLKKETQQVTRKLSPGIAKAINIIHTKLKGPIRLGDLAEESGYSLPYFSLLFKKESGFSPKQYIMHAKIRRAKDMLINSSMNFSEIAQRCGYRDIFDFSRHFKKAIGLSPTDFRKSARV
jgi:AraC family transcriptional regulator